MSKRSRVDPWHESLTRGYEPGDFRLRWVAVFVVGFIVLAAAVHAGLWLFLRGVDPERPVDRPRSVASGNPPAPRPAPLQPSVGHDRMPVEDLESMRRGEDRVFAALGWKVDAERHRASPPDELVHVVRSRVEAERRPSPVTRPAPGPTVTPVPGADEGGR